MRSLSTQESQTVSGGGVDLFDLGYLFAGYHHFDMSCTLLTAAVVGATFGLIKIVSPVAGADPLVGFFANAAWVVIPALYSVGMAFVEYQIGSYSAQWVSEA